MGQNYWDWLESRKAAEEVKVKEVIPEETNKKLEEVVTVQESNLVGTVETEAPTVREEGAKETVVILEEVIEKLEGVAEVVQENKEAGQVTAIVLESNLVDIVKAVEKNEEVDTVQTVKPGELSGSKTVESPAAEAKVCQDDGIVNKKEVHSGEVDCPVKCTLGESNLVAQPDTGRGFRSPAITGGQDSAQGRYKTYQVHLQTKQFKAKPSQSLSKKKVHLVTDKDKSSLKEVYHPLKYTPKYKSSSPKVKSCKKIKSSPSNKMISAPNADSDKTGSWIEVGQVLRSGTSSTLNGKSSRAIYSGSAEETVARSVDKREVGNNAVIGKEIMEKLANSGWEGGEVM